MAQQTYLLSWGSNIVGQLDLGYESKYPLIYTPKEIENVGNILTWTQVVCGGLHSAALSSNGEVYTWGWGIWGVLGHSDGMSRNEPTKVESLSRERIVKIACGSTHTVALTAAGEVFTWYVV